MNTGAASKALGQGRGTAPFPGTPSPKAKPGRLHKRIDTPIGLATTSTTTSILGSVPSVLRTGGFGVTAVSKPMEHSSRCSASLALRPLSPVVETFTPVDGCSGYTPPPYPPNRENGSSGGVFNCAAGNATAISFANCDASGLPPRYDTPTLTPGNCLRLAAIADCCSFDSLRHATLASNLARAELSSSVSFVSSVTSWFDLWRNSVFLVRNSPFSSATSMPTPNSPATPSATKIEPISPHVKRERDGLSGGRTMPLFHSVISSLCSRTNTLISIATPTTTMPVKTQVSISQSREELSKAVIALSRADMALSKAEASVGRAEATWIKCAKITIVALLLSVAVKRYARQTVSQCQYA